LSLPVLLCCCFCHFFFFQAEDGIRDFHVTGVQTCALPISAQDLIKSKIVDRIIPEPPGGAHSDPEATMKAVADAIEEELDALEGVPADELRKMRSARFYAIGR